MYALMMQLDGKKKLKVEKMNKSTKILVAGVGGQGVVFLTNLLVKAALKADIPVATSEIHGLAQRGGSVTAGLTLGENTYGFLEKGGIDYLIGLEPLEAQRASTYLNKNSKVIINDSRIFPYSVNSGSASYPDIEKFVGYLQNNISKVIYITENPNNIKTILQNLYVLGRVCNELQFPIPIEHIESAILELAREGFEEKSLEAFRMGINKTEIIVESN